MGHVIQTNIPKGLSSTPSLETSLVGRGGFVTRQRNHLTATKLSVSSGAAILDPFPATAPRATNMAALVLQRCKSMFGEPLRNQQRVRRVQVRNAPISAGQPAPHRHVSLVVPVCCASIFMLYYIKAVPRGGTTLTLLFLQPKSNICQSGLLDQEN